MSKNIDVFPTHGPEHKTNGDGVCWCEPELHYLDPVTGIQVWTHKEIQ